jgi:hypothetical protein
MRPIPAPGWPDWTTSDRTTCDHVGVTVTSVHDRDELEALLRRDPALHAYELGDLDDLLWPYTNWYRRGDAVALLYHGVRPPIVLALDHGTQQTVLSELLAGVLPLLPRRFYAHLSPGVDGVLTTSFVAEHRGKHLKMALTDLSRLRQVAPAGDVLGPDDLPDLVTFYEVAYPANSFDERMLGMGPYIGIRRDGGLVAVAARDGRPRHAQRQGRQPRRDRCLHEVGLHPGCRPCGVRLRGPLNRSDVAGFAKRLAAHA